MGDDREGEALAEPERSPVQGSAGASPSRSSPVRQVSGGTMKHFAIVAVTVLIPSLASAQQPDKKPTLPLAPEGVVIEQNIAYLPEGRMETADLYLPAKRGKDERSPAVVIIHGGGWTGGDKAAAREFNIGTNL